MNQVLRIWGVLLATVSCGFGGKVDLGDGQLGDGVAKGGFPNGGSGTAWPGGSTGQGGSSAQGGSTSDTGSGGAGTTGNALQRYLTMDATGEVPLASNTWGIQGKWYAFSDELDGGKTRIDGFTDGFVPYVPGRGMCIHGTTESGLADNFKTWGAGIGIAVNVVDGVAQTLVSPPECFTIVISSDAQYPGDLRADLHALDPYMGQAPNVMLYPGSNEVCLRDAQKFAYCTPALNCLEPDSLNQGLAKINIVVATIDRPGPIDVCIESITPHHYPL